MQRNLAPTPTFAPANGTTLPTVQPLATVPGAQIFPTLVGGTRPNVQTVRVPTIGAIPTMQPQPVTIQPQVGTTQLPLQTFTLPLQPVRQQPTPINFGRGGRILTPESDTEDFDDTDDSELYSDDDEEFSESEETGFNPIPQMFPLKPITPFPGVNRPLATIPNPVRTQAVPIMTQPLVPVAQPTAPLLPGIGTMPFVRPLTQPVIPIAQPGLTLTINKPVTTPTIPVIRPGTTVNLPIMTPGTIRPPTINLPVTTPGTLRPPTVMLPPTVMTPGVIRPPTINLPVTTPGTLRPPTVMLPPTVMTPGVIRPPTVMIPPTVIRPPTVIAPVTTPGIIKPPTVILPPTVVRPPTVVKPPTVILPPTVVKPPTVILPPTVVRPPTVILPPTVKPPTVILPPTVRPPTVILPPTVRPPTVILPPVTTPGIIRPPTVMLPPIVRPPTVNTILPQVGTQLIFTPTQTTPIIRPGTPTGSPFKLPTIPGFGTIPIPQSPFRVQSPVKVQTPNVLPLSPRVTTGGPVIPTTAPVLVPLPRLIPIGEQQVAPLPLPQIIATPQPIIASPRSPQRTPLAGTVTGGPVIPTTAPQLVPLPRLVPVTQQNQVNPLPEINRTPQPTIISPRTTPVVPLVPLVTSPRTTPVVPLIASPRRPTGILVPTIQSPRSPTLVPVPIFTPANTTFPGRQQAIPIIGGVITHVDNHPGQAAGHEHLDCCVCTEPTVLPNKMTACGHAICADCTQQLRKAECPVCRATLEAGYLTQDKAQAIQAAAANDARVLDLVGRAKGNYSAKYPERVFAGDATLAPEAEAYGNAFSEFVEANPGMSNNDLDRTFDGFIDFMTLEREKGRRFTLETGVNSFSIIGYTMLANPLASFNQVYQEFFRTDH